MRLQMDGVLLLVLLIVVICFVFKQDASALCFFSPNQLTEIPAQIRRAEANRLQHASGDFVNAKR